MIAAVKSGQSTLKIGSYDSRFWSGVVLFLLIRRYHNRVIADEAAIGVINQKTTAVRIIPMVGR
ncbi:MAG: DUF711 family protein [Streptococcus sp.]